jgi:DNA-binding transcriptional LysR family regulator
MLPDLDALRALDAVVRLRGFERAAQHLHKVPSAVSYQVAKLERQLGLPLLDRRGYRVALTPAGEAVLAEGRQLLAKAEHVESMARQFVEGWEPRLTLIIDGILPLEPTLQALKALADERLPTRIQVKVEYLGGVQFRFEQDDADLMLVKDYQSAHSLSARALPEIECVLCIAPGHPLAGKRSVSLAALHEHVELSVQDSSGQGNDRHTFGGERMFHLSGFDAKKQALLMGVGFGWMPLYAVAAELARGTLRELRFSGGSRYRFTPLLVHRSQRPLGRTGMRLVELIQGSLPAAARVRADGRTGRRNRPARSPASRPKASGGRRR